jgi:hypothetical protein
MNVTDDAVETFFSAIGDAEEMLGALLVPEADWGPEGAALKKFVCVVRALLTGTVPPVERTEWTNTLNLTQGLIGTPLESWKTMCCNDGGEGGKERVLRFASESLCSLIKEEIAPMRCVTTLSNNTLQFDTCLVVFSAQFVGSILSVKRPCKSSTCRSSRCTAYEIYDT